MGLKLVTIPHLSQTPTSNIRRYFASLTRKQRTKPSKLSTSQALEKLYIRVVNERRHVLLEQIQEDNEQEGKYQQAWRWNIQEDD